MDSELVMAAGVFGAMLIVYVLMWGLVLTNYILTAIGLQTLAKRRGIPSPWLAWIPVANYWLIGSLADDYDARIGLKRRWNMVLLILYLSVVVLTVAMYVIVFASIFVTTFQSLVYEPEVGQILGTIIPIYLVMIVMALAASAAQICGMVCYNKIFESTVPEKSVKYLFISILVPLGSGICLMKCRYQGYPVNDMPLDMEEPLRIAEDSE